MKGRRSHEKLVADQAADSSSSSSSAAEVRGSAGGNLRGVSLVTRIADGYEVRVSCHDGALVDLQAADEERPAGTWELMISKGQDGTLDGLKPEDLIKIGSAIVNLGAAVKEGRS
jgi:hypothetical protein